ncbi:DIR1-like [Hibiscus trionum]|uniref:DIR1-like n=1 Tax=Hibiscus trionum TaxID=183268 RepID=A0A9W7I598_HIBTR|nr:DIR1-like [Hibiscus trionum]
MEGYAKLMVVTMVLVALALGSGPIVANGQKVCGMSKEDFEACQPSVSATDPNPPPPSAMCCKALENANFRCLCFFKNSKWMTDYGIDFDRAKDLPSKCNLGKSVTC